jgi:hypothetical protein
MKENAMKKQAYMIATMIMLLTVAGLSSAKAQTSGAHLITANIPFVFNVGEKSFPAGEYTVAYTNTASDRKVLQLRGKAGSILVQTNSVIGQNHEEAKLVFNRYGDRYYLSQAWLAADNTGMQVRKSRSEKATANELASIKRATEMVALSRKR